MSVEPAPGQQSLRPVRSYHQRKGKTTPTQARGLAQGWDTYGVTLDAAVDLIAMAAADQKVVLDVGFGMGESVLHLAALEPDTLIVGLEVHERGIGQLLAALLDAPASDGGSLANVRVLQHDAAEVVRALPAEPVLAEFRLFFPDPWPKSRHHKRRLVQPAVVHELALRMKQGGRVYCATDWRNYADHMAEVLAAEPLLARRDDLVPSMRTTRPTTKYEAIGLAKGHQVTDLVFERL